MDILKFVKCRARDKLAALATLTTFASKLKWAKRASEERSDERVSEASEGKINHIYIIYIYKFTIVKFVIAQFTYKFYHAAGIF